VQEPAQHIEATPQCPQDRPDDMQVAASGRRLRP
jgi:hypothetical protein